MTYSTFLHCRDLVSFALNEIKFMFTRETRSSLGRCGCRLRLPVNCVCVAQSSPRAAGAWSQPGAGHGTGLECRLRSGSVCRVLGAIPSAKGSLSAAAWKAASLPATLHGKAPISTLEKVDLKQCLTSLFVCRNLN